MQLGRAVAADVEQEAADRLGGLARVAAQLVERGVAAALEIGPEPGQQLGELGDRQREPVDGVGERDEHRVLGACRGRRRGAAASQRSSSRERRPSYSVLVGEVVGDAREREQREDVLAQRRAREHRRRPGSCGGARGRAPRSTGSRRRARASAAAGRRGRGASDSEAMDHGDSFRRREDLACAVRLDVAARRQLGGDALDELAGGPGGAGDAARVQRHVAALDALGGERAQRGEVRGEAGGGGDRGEPVGVVDAGELEREPRAGVRRAARRRPCRPRAASPARRRARVAVVAARSRAGDSGRCARRTRGRRPRPRASPGRSRRARRRRRS